MAYTFDAGPNAVIFTLEDTVDEFVEVVKRSFPPESNGDQYVGTWLGGLRGWAGGSGVRGRGTRVPLTLQPGLSLPHSDHGLTHPLCPRFLQGLPVGPAVLSEELQSAVVLEPVPGAIRYILHTQVGVGAVGMERAVQGTAGL